MHISINKPMVFREVAMLTAYIGVKHPDPVLAFDRLAVVKADTPLLEIFWRDSCRKANHALQEYLRHGSFDHHAPHTALPCSKDNHLCRPHDDDYHACLLLPGNHDDSQLHLIEGALHAFFVHHIAARWLDIAMPEAENRHASQAAEQLALLATALEKRKRAVRPLPCIPPVPPVNPQKP